jgi:preprotein translocase subunit SecE
MLGGVLGKLATYFNEVRFEVKKISWPKRDELIGATIIVCILVVIFALILGGMDTAFGYLIKRIVVG